jgi:hypothetical protein
MEERSCDAVTAVGHQVGLEKARGHVTPIGERPDGNLSLDEGPRPSDTLPFPLLVTLPLEQSIHRCWTQRQKPFPDSEVQRQVPETFKGGHKVRQERNQPFRTDPVGGSPDSYQSFDNSIIVEAWPPFFRVSFLTGSPMIEQGHGILATITRRNDKLVQDALLLFSIGFSVTTSDAIQQLST